jgi:hypothetical protein
MAMKLKLVLLFSLLFNLVNAQSVIEWTPDYKLQLSDFQGEGTKIGGIDIYSLHSASTVGFTVQMTNIQFMMTKNFNSKVDCDFTPEVASLIAPNEEIAQKLLDFAQYEFDVCELYARKLRKALYEEKGTFSDMSYMMPIYNKIRKESTDRIAIAGRQSDVGRNSEKLKELHDEVVKEIAELPDYCKTCKPNKKKK